MNLFNRNKQNASDDNADLPEIRTKHAVKRGWRNISSTVVLLVAAPLLALLITSHFFHSYQVDGASMETTLQDGDRLIVYKLAKTISNLKGSTYMPGRDDIIVFDRPKQLAAPNSVSHLIKRVIAMPGERVVIRNGSVIVYNFDNPDGFNPDGGKEYAKDITNTSGNVDITVGQGEVFVLGDNRSNSSDSRIFGTIDTKTIVGNATIRFLPTDAMRRL